MEILFIIILVLIILFVLKFIKKPKDTSSIEINQENDNTRKATLILEKYFRNKSFQENIDLLDLKNKLGIKLAHKNELTSVIKEAEHKINIQYTHNMNNNKPYTDFTSLKICSNEVIDYCIKKNILMKNAIILLFLTITNQTIKDILDEEIEDEKCIEYFYALLPKFIERYNKKLLLNI